MPTCKRHSVKVVKDDLLELLVHLLLFPQNHITLPLDRIGLELRVLQNVRDDADGLADVLLECLGIVDGLLTRGVCIEVCAEVLDLELERLLVARLGPLEGHVLEEVRAAVGVAAVHPAAGVHPYADSCSLRVRLALGCDGQAVGQGRDVRHRVLVLGGRAGGRRGDGSEAPQRTLVERQPCKTSGQSPGDEMSTRARIVLGHPPASGMPAHPASTQP